MSDRATNEGKASVAMDDAILNALSEKYRIDLDEVKRVIAAAHPRTREEAEALVMARSQQHTGNPHHGGDEATELVRREEPSKVHGDKLSGV